MVQDDQMIILCGYFGIKVDEINNIVILIYCFYFGLKLKFQLLLFFSSKGQKENLYGCYVYFILFISCINFVFLYFINLSLDNWLYLLVRKGRNVCSYIVMCLQLKRKKGSMNIGEKLVSFDMDR